MNIYITRDYLNGSKPTSRAIPPELVNDPDFFIAPEDETCYEPDCNEPAIGCIYIWYEPEDLPGTMPWYCEKHL